MVMDPVESPKQPLRISAAALGPGPSGSSAIGARALAGLALIGVLGLLWALFSIPLQAQGSDTIAVWYGAPPTIDGVIGAGEYGASAVIQFACQGGTCTAYLRHDTSNLYVALDSPDTTPYPTPDGGPAMQLFLNTNNDMATKPQTDDYRLTIFKNNSLREDRGDGSGWPMVLSPSDWEGAASSHGAGWQAEYSISLVKLGITAGTAKTIGFTMANAWTSGLLKDYWWPTTAVWNNPSTWGNAYSEEDWTRLWHFEEGGWIDYAPNGLPDFDQKQDNWKNPPSSGPWTYCGPVAAANSLWWFDSKFEPSPLPPPLDNDHYSLVTSYMPGIDDHDPVTVGGMGPPGLVDELAWYFDTDGLRTGLGQHQGTRVRDMSYGLQWLLYGTNPTWGAYPFRPRSYSYYDDYHVQLVKMPTWAWVKEEVERSEDVVLLLGFWQDQDPGEAEDWKRLGGHFVTVAGINSTDLQIALSDPFFDRAEAGGAGRVMSGSLLVPHTPGHATFLHNDAGNLSHDIYTVTMPASSPGGLWEIADYVYPAEVFDRQNVPEEFEGEQGKYEDGLPVLVEVEYALAMSPFYWKPGGEWVDSFWEGKWMTEWWSYEDDADSCLPDFWLWEEGEAFLDGPVALANSLWWFDSKAETLITGGSVITPPVRSDHYDLIVGTEKLDDHDPENTGEVISTLAKYLNAWDKGTTIPAMAAGIDAYLADRRVAVDFYTKTLESPTWEWIADEVETSEDVILLLGFYEQTDPGLWERKGGHWVNAAGLNRSAHLIGLSDPAIDNANSESISYTLHLGRVFPPEQLGTPFSKAEKLQPQSISHDIYSVTANADLNQLILVGYPFTITSVLSNYVGLNGGGEDVRSWHNPLVTAVEWAIGVSPHSELVVTKRSEAFWVGPGDLVTYSIQYANHGLAAAQNVIISDLLPLDSLTNIAYSTNPPLSASPGVTYSWTLPRLSYEQGGAITITAQAVVSTFLENRVTITGENAIGGPTPDRDPANNASSIQAPQWQKWINGVEWSPGISITVEVSDTILITEVVWIDPARPFTLTESWNPAELRLDHYQQSGGVVLDPPGGGWQWSAAPGHAEIMTLTKWFHVEPCTWTETLLWEELWVDGIEFGQRPVTVAKLPSELWIDAEYNQAVLAGEETTFSLLYGNEGSREYGALIRNEFPAEAPFVISNPFPDRVGAANLWAEWDLPSLELGQEGTISVTVAILSGLSPSTTVEIWDGIFDHAGTLHDEITFTYQITGCVELTAITIAGPINEPPGSYTFTTSLQPANATPPLAYLWDNGDTGPISMRTLSSGTHTLVVTATNCTRGLVTDSHVITIASPSCIEVEMVQLRLTSPEPLYAGNTAELEADIGPDDAGKPYLYRLTVDGVAGTTQTASDDPLSFSHRFDGIGTHRVEMAVWNCGLSEAQAVTGVLDVEVDAFGVYLPIVLKNNE